MKRLWKTAEAWQCVAEAGVPKEAQEMDLRSTGNASAT